MHSLLALRLLSEATLLVAALGLTLSACSSPTTLYSGSHFEVIHISASLQRQAHIDFIQKSAGGRYLGSASAGEYMARHFDLETRTYVVSEDGTRLLYTHKSFFARGRTDKAGGVYLVEADGEDRLVYADDALGTRWSRWPQPLPDNGLVVHPREQTGPLGRTPPWFVTIDGAQSPLPLLGTSALQQQIYAGDTLAQDAATAACRTEHKAPVEHFSQATLVQTALLQGHQTVAISLFEAGCAVTDADWQHAAALRLPDVLTWLIEHTPPGKQKQAWATDAIFALLQKQPAWDAENVWGRTAVNLRAFETADETLLRELVTHGATLNATDSNGHTPLVHLVRLLGSRQNVLPLMHTLLDMGADPNMADPGGRTALHYLAQGSRAENNAAWTSSSTSAALDALLTSGAQVNRADNGGATPLLLAVQANNLRTAEHLVAAGADDQAEYTDADGRSTGESIRSRINQVARSDWWRRS